MKIFLLESYRQRKYSSSINGFNLDMEYLHQIYQEKNLSNKDISWSNKFLWRIKYYVENPRDYFAEYLNFASKLINNKILSLNKLTSFFYDKEKLVSSLLEDEELTEDIFPLLLYVSAFQNEYDDIGLLIFEDHIEHFEGNEEVTEETNTLISKLMEEGEHEVKVFANHGKNVIDFVKKTKQLPKGIYVSPNKQHALSHWDMKEDRYLISGYVKLVDLNRESDIDWKVNKNTPITKLTIV